MRMERKGVKRGVSVYSYAGEYGVTMTLEDIFADIHSMGARGLEILGNSHIPDYPNPSEAWIEMVRAHGEVRPGSRGVRPLG